MWNSWYLSESDLILSLYAFDVSAVVLDAILKKQEVLHLSIYSTLVVD